MAFKRVNSVYFMADSKEDLKDLPASAMGAECYVISEACEYKANSKGEWIIQRAATVAPGSVEVDLTGYATEKYVDKAVASVEVPSVDGLASEKYVNELIAKIQIPSIEGLASEKYVDEAIALANPVKDIYGDAHAFGLMVDSKDGKTLVEAMLEKGKVGMYNFHIEKGCPGQPEEVIAKNSSCRGVACVDTYRSDENWYGWILMFDQDGDTYVQYIRNAIPQGWKNLTKKPAVAVVNCAEYGLIFKNGTTGDIAIFDEIDRIHNAGQMCYLRGWYGDEGFLEVAISGYEYDTKGLMGVCLTGCMVETKTGQMLTINGIIAKQNDDAVCYMLTTPIGSIIG